MPRQAKQLKAGEAEQPLLFSISDLPEAPELVELAKRYERSGKILGKDEQRLEDIVTDVEMGLSMRKIALKHSISRNSIAMCCELLQERGKLEPLKERLKVKIGRLAESSIDLTQELIDEGTLPPQSAPIVMGVALDKKAQMDGDATLVVEHRTSGQQAADAWLEQFKALAGKPAELPSAAVPGVTDCESPEKLLQVPANERASEMATTLVTSPERKTATDGHQSGPDQAGTDDAKGGGGGGRDGGAGHHGGGIDG